MNIIETYYNFPDPSKAKEMSAYMRNQFPFLGIQSPLRAELNRSFFQSIKGDKVFDWDFVFQCIDQREREFTYLATEYMYRRCCYINPDDFINIEKAALIKPWWDSIDSIAPTVGKICQIHPWQKENFVEKWIYADNIWLKRISIIFQLKYKKDTDLQMLSKAILSNTGTKEFFVDKAIGWALREYSKTDAQWVIDFVEKNEISRLSKSEALKVINR